jgi:predicted DNA-binding transcriptional regulator AlpA
VIDEKVGPKGIRLISMRKAIGDLGCTRSTIKRLIDAGELRSFQYTNEGWHWVHARSIEEYLARRNKKSAPKKQQRRHRA